MLTSSNEDDLAGQVRNILFRVELSTRHSRSGSEGFEPAVGRRNARWSVAEGREGEQSRTPGEWILDVNVGEPGIGKLVPLQDIGTDPRP